MTLAARLDANNDLEDAVAELVLSGEWGRSLERIDHVPTIEELEAERQAEENRTKALTDEERQAEQQAGIRAKVEAREQFVAARNENLTRRLVELSDAATILELLDRTAREVQQIRADKQIFLISLWNLFEQQAPELLGGFATGIAGKSPGPLDNALEFIIERWLRANPTEAAAWVRDSVSVGRKEVRLAIAASFTRAGWEHHGEELSAIWTQGLTDDDPDVVQAFLRGAGGYLRTNPSKPSTSYSDTTSRPSEPPEYSRTRAVTTVASTARASMRTQRPGSCPSSPAPALTTTPCRRS